METSKEASSEVLRDVMSEVLEQARKAPEVPQNQHHQIITLHHAEPPKPAPWHSTVCVVASLVCVLVTSGSLYVASEAKSETRAVRMELQHTRMELMGEIRDLRNTDNAIRAYINTGRMPTQKQEK